MKLNKILKYSLLSFLMLGSASLTGCAKNGKDGIDGLPGEKGDQGIQGPIGETGQQGIPGINGATWLTGENSPAENTGVVGDFYYDTINNRIYNKKTTGWELVVELAVKADDNFSDGVYVFKEEISDTMIKYSEFIFSKNANLLSFKTKTENIIEEGTSLENLGLIPVAVDGEVVTIADAFSGETAITLDPTRIYTVNNNVPYHFSNIDFYGTIKGDLTTVNFKGTEVKVNTEYVQEVTVINKNIFKVNLSGIEQYYEVVGSMNYNGTKVNEINQIYYVSAEQAPLVYGVYTSQTGDSLAISKDELLIYTSGKKYTLKYEFVGGGVDSGYFYVSAKTDDVEFLISIDLHTRTFGYNSIEYNFEKTYYNSSTGQNLILEKNTNGYTAIINDGTPINVAVYSSTNEFEKKYIFSEDGTIKFMLNSIDDTFYSVEEINKEFVGVVLLDEIDNIEYYIYDTNKTIVDVKLKGYSTYVDGTLININLVTGIMDIGNYTLGVSLSINIENIQSNVYMNEDWKVMFNLDENGSIKNVTIEPVE